MEETNKRQIGEYTLTRNDPYGFWTISVAKGKVPADLSGQFTDLRHVKALLGKLPKTKKE